ncbi:LytTR family DNA-binding domain-containing protein [Sphingomonas asaccharolytica]|uniref:LytTR family DNA-binding domain-containing protein n=1 Tax=Sphingomonas asaccharolytica TaxID=40681 RepID=UPI001470D515|nr:LytTR family DNA-binding domain-containing protein [Sphingomonas asaccharolytica]
MAGTSGGLRGMNGTQRKLAAGLVAGFLTIVALIMIANAESSIADLHASGAHIRPDLVWSWEWTSMIAWLSVYPLLWFGVATIRPPRFSWPLIAAALVIGSLIASGWHIGVMVVLRRIYYDAVGQGPYHFFGVVDDRLLYEFRKDFATYLQFIIIAAVGQWLIARAATPPNADASPRTLAVADGAVTHLVPVEEIESIASAGNYVEIAWGPRTLLHRATLAAVEAELGEAFLRIHRGRLVRRAAIRRIEIDKSGDFTVELASGAMLRGSRRYRPAD